MTFLDRLERPLGRYAIHGLIRYIVALNGLVYLLGRITPEYLSYLRLEPSRILHGEVWRLVSWIFVPGEFSGSLGPLFAAIALMFLWFLGDVVEGVWGTFRLNLYFLTGMITCTAAALIFPTAQTGYGANDFLILSMILAAGTLAGDLQILLFFFIPFKLRWLAWLSGGFFLLSLLGATWIGRMALLMCLANYAIFFGPGFLQHRAQAKKTAMRRAKFEKASAPDETLHRCEVCGRTEVSDPNLEFRVRSDGHEYCEEHLSGS